MITKPNLANGIHSLASFKRDSGFILEKMRKDKEPVVLTVNGKAEAVLLDPSAYEELLEQLQTVQAVRQSMASFKRGGGRLAKTALSEIRKRHAIPISS